MKTIIISILFLFIISNDNLLSTQKNNVQDKDAYAENVHMYICIEALKLLKDRFPQYNFSQIENRIGTTDDCGTRPWQVGTITAGACREDREDVVFDIRGPFGWYASNSHFWHADNRTDGDHSLTNLQLIGDYPNAYTKITKFINGDWRIWSDGYQGRNYINYLHTNGLIYRYTYHDRGYFNFFRTKKLILHSRTNLLGQEEILDEEVTLDDYRFNKIVWEILGRMAHLPQDMTVPSHTHNDVHPDILGGDCYHSFIDNGAYQYYNWLTAKNAGGLINPYETGDEPIRYLMYAANQLADHYPSGPDCLEIPQQHLGDNNLPGGTYTIITQYYQQLGPPPQNITNLNEEGSYCFNHAIRATAGLFYWFAVETGIISPDPGVYPVINSFSRNLPDNFIFRGETFRLTCNASGSGLNYNWFIKVCGINNTCNIPINGLAFNKNGNVYSITNNNFNNRWTCSYYDSSCNANNHDNSNLLENPLNFYIGVTAYNQFGQVTKYFNFNNLESINPFNGIRPPPPPPPYYGGCPFIVTGVADQMKYENNVLHRSTHFENRGKDIEDKLLIRNKPILDTTDNTFLFAIKETDVDFDYFDNVKLMAIDHPEKYIVSISKYNDILLIDPDKILSPEYAQINGNDVTQILAYDSAFDKGVKSKRKEFIGLKYDLRQNHFSSKEKLTNELRKVNVQWRGMTDSLALIIDPFQTDETPILNKDISGNVSFEDSSGINTGSWSEFSRRQIRDMVTIPFDFKEDVLKVKITCKNKYDLSYAGIAKAIYGGFTEHDLQLIYAENSLSGDILKTLTFKDNKYAEMDSSSFIILKFRNTTEKIPDGWVRDYVLVVNGKTIAPALNDQSGLRNIFLNKTSDELPDKFEVLQNFPNPFNPKTIINYSIPSNLNDQMSDVRLVVYDNLGKEVVELVNGKQSAGNYSVEFDGSNFPSGIYYYKIESGNLSQVRKMILIK